MIRCLSFLFLSFFIFSGLLLADNIDNDLISAIIQVESGGDPHAVGKAGEIGLLQISPIVLEELKQVRNMPKDTIIALNDPMTNKMVGLFYLKRLRDHYIPKEKYSLKVLLASWNFGPTAMRKLKWDWTKAPKETRNFVKKVLKLYYRQIKN